MTIVREEEVSVLHFNRVVVKAREIDEDGSH